MKAARFPRAAILQPGMLERGELARGVETWGMKLIPFLSSVSVAQVRRCGAGAGAGGGLLWFRVWMSLRDRRRVLRPGAARHTPTMPAAAVLRPAPTAGGALHGAGRRALARGARWRWRQCSGGGGNSVRAGGEGVQHEGDHRV